MTCVQSLDGQLTVVTNLKSGFSWLQRLEREGKVRYVRQYIARTDQLATKLQSPQHVVFLLREPMARFESFFLDKFVRNRHTAGTPQQQLCQQRMLKHVDAEKIRANRMTLSDAVQALRDGYTEGHADPQSDLYYGILQLWGKQNVKVVQFQQGEEMQQLARRLGVDEQLVHVRTNCSDRERQECANRLKLSAEDLEFLQRFYAKDFELFESLFGKTDAC